MHMAVALGCTLTRAGSIALSRDGAGHWQTRIVPNTRIVRVTRRVPPAASFC